MLAVIAITLNHGASGITRFDAVILIVGGTSGILFLGTPWRVLQLLGKMVLDLLKPEQDLGRLKEPIQRLTRDRTSCLDSPVPLLSYASSLWEQGVDSEVFIALLSERKRELELKALDAVQALKNLAKYPPALGMVGTVVGMIGLFSDLDHNRNLIGQNLSLALTSTLLGLLLANLVVSPLSDRLQIYAAQSQQLNSHIYELLLLINRGEPTSLVEEEIHGRAA
jgi:chemotaxis protein MotA